MLRECKQHPGQGNMVWGCDECKTCRDFNERDAKNAAKEAKRKAYAEKLKQRKGKK